MNKTIGGTMTQFLYDGLNPVQELDGASPSNVTANLLTGLGIDERFTRTDSSGAATFLSDALGSTIGLSNSSGAVATSYTYDPFGNVTASGSSNANPYQFTGRENDGTGLYFYRARYYSPTFQRFIGQDPIEFAGGSPNLYSYALNNPVSFRDPSGKILPILIAGGLIGVGAAAYSNYGAYESGAITGGQYAEALAFGAATGVLTALPTGIVGSIIAGGLGSAANNLVDQRLRQPCGDLNLGTAGVAGLIGAGGGFASAELGQLGESIISLNPSMGETLLEVSGGYPTPGYTSLGTPGGIVGNVIGTGAGAYLGPQ